MDIQTRLRKYQRKAAVKIAPNKAGALFFDTGTGKTLTALYLIHRWKCRRTLVICPKQIIGVWRRQIERHCTGKIVIHERDFPSRTWNRPQFLLANYGWIRGNKDALFKWNPDAVIADESHKLKGRNSAQSKNAYYVARRTEHKLILTATPTDKEVWDLFGQFRFLAPEVFGTTWDGFDKKYLKKTGYMGYARKITPRNRKRVLNKIKPYSVRISKKQALPELPDYVELELYAELQGKQNTVYRKLEKDFYAELEGNPMITPLAVTQQIRLQQILGGFYHGEKSIDQFRVNPKLDALMDTIEPWDYNRKFVVFARFIPEVKLIAHAIRKTGRTVATLHGMTKDRDVWMEFQDSDDPQVMVIQSDTGGEGIELFRASDAFFFSCGFSFINFDQCRGRLHRDGQKSSVNFFLVKAENTIDDYVQDVLENKSDVTKTIWKTLQGET